MLWNCVLIFGLFSLFWVNRHKLCLLKSKQLSMMSLFILVVQVESPFRLLIASIFHRVDFTDGRVLIIPEGITNQWQVVNSSVLTWIIIYIVITINYLLKRFLIFEILRHFWPQEYITLAIFGKFLRNIWFFVLGLFNVL